MTLPTPRTALLLDGIGALATALMLCGVLPMFHEAVGLSRGVLVTLGLFGAVYGAYSLACARFVTTHARRALAIIMVANLVYCGVSASVVLTHGAAMTALGIAYFAAEIVVILALVAFEWAVVRRDDVTLEARLRSRHMRDPASS